MLSTVSPSSAIRSITFSGGTPRISVTFAASTIVSAFAPPDPVRKIRTPEFTSCIMSLSFDTTSTSSLFAAFFAIVPITSSASYPSSSRIGSRIASHSLRTYGNCTLISSGIGGRWALYFSNNLSRNVGCRVSNTIATYSGW